MQHINWDNLRYVLMVAKKGSISAAARELAVNRTTVLRRINAFQDNLNCRIFERGDLGYILTPEAEKMLDAAQEVESTLFDMQRQIAGQELRLEGELRVTTTDTLMVSVIGPHLASFHRQHPHIVVDVVMTNNILDLGRRDADIAIRPTALVKAPMVGRKVAELYFGIYASPSYLASCEISNLFEHKWLGFDDSLKPTAPGTWLEANVPGKNVCLRADSFVTLKVAAECGMGLALLPHYLGNSSELLQRLPASTTELTSGIWLITHPDLFRSAKVHAFMDHIGKALKKNMLST